MSGGIPASIARVGANPMGGAGVFAVQEAARRAAPIVPRPLAPPPAGTEGQTTIFVGALDPSVSENELLAAFQVIGPVSAVKIPRDKGCGFVQYQYRIHAERALNALQGLLLGPCRIRLAWGKNQLGTRPIPAGGYEMGDMGLGGMQGGMGGGPSSMHQLGGPMGMQGGGMSGMGGKGGDYPGGMGFLDYPSHEAVPAGGSGNAGGGAHSSQPGSSSLGLGGFSAGMPGGHGGFSSGSGMGGNSGLGGMGGLGLGLGSSLFGSVGQSKPGMQGYSSGPNPSPAPATPVDASPALSGIGSVAHMPSFLTSDALGSNSPAFNSSNGPAGGQGSAGLAGLPPSAMGLDGPGAGSIGGGGGWGSFLGGLSGPNQDTTRAF